jgi:hypothetical protein
VDSIFAVFLLRQTRAWALIISVKANSQPRERLMMRHGRSVIPAMGASMHRVVKESVPIFSMHYYTWPKRGEGNRPAIIDAARYIKNN